jgi:hypothetical protein
VEEKLLGRANPERRQAFVEQIQDCRRRVNTRQIGRSKIPQVTQLSGLRSIGC